MTYRFDHELHIHSFSGKIIPGATEILRDAGFKGPDGNMEMGRAVHIATQYDDEGTLNFASVSDEVYPYLEGWRKFRSETGFKPNRIEEPNINQALWFAAVLDREGTWDKGNAHVLVEIKKYSPPYFTGLQLALQDLTLPTLSLPRKRIAVELKADGTYKIHEYRDANDRSMAIFLVSLYWLKKNNGG